MILGARKGMLGTRQVILGAGQVVLGTGQVILGAGQVILGTGKRCWRWASDTGHKASDTGHRQTGSTSPPPSPAQHKPQLQQCPGSIPSLRPWERLRQLPGLGWSQPRLPAGLPEPRDVPALPGAGNVPGKLQGQQFCHSALRRARPLLPAKSAPGSLDKSDFKRTGFFFPADFGWTGVNPPSLPSQQLLLHTSPRAGSPRPMSHPGDAQVLTLLLIP